MSRSTVDGQEAERVNNELVVIAGLSGAGRSMAADHLEDLGWFVMDNVPAELVAKVGELAAGPGAHGGRMALVIRGGDYDHEIHPALVALRASGAAVRILFLDASTNVLVRRYDGSRRRHPLGGASLTEAIEAERVQLEPLKAQANVVIDTSDLNVHQLRAWLADLFGTERQAEAGVQASVVSFGFKHGLPIDVDMVFDCRFLPNPHWVEALRPLTGEDEAVQRYVLGQEPAAPFLEGVGALLDTVVPAFLKEGKTYLRIGLGCTGGQHRSVVMATEVAKLLAARGFRPLVAHRDLHRANT